jgi:26S proteasome regulatory subunit N3
LTALVDKYIPVDSPIFNTLKQIIEKVPVDASEAEKEPKVGDDEMEVDSPIQGTVLSVLPEVEVYLFTLVVTTLLRHQLNTEAALASTLLIDRIRTFNRRSLDVFSSKAYFYYSLSHEKLNALEKIRPMLLVLYRTACVRRDDIGQSVLLNLLMRNYLHYNLVEQAHTLSMRATFPETASNNQFCRYLYYMGRIQAIQLEYSEAYQRLMMAARKAPQGYASGFSKLVHKLIVIVQLLMGDIPERSLFNQPDLRGALKPYFALTQAVRNGDLIQFQKVTEQYAEAFQADKTQTLVERLGHNVLKTGLRKISVSYTRVSLKDIAEKLHLPSVVAAEYICAKAIRDGVIEAKIDHENGWLSSHEVLDLYSTDEPQKAFHK